LWDQLLRRFAWQDRQKRLRRLIAAPNNAPFIAGAALARLPASGATSFANPAVTIARALTDTFAGIRLIETP